MQKHNPMKVFILSIITFSIYEIIWLARTRGEMVRLGADIPTTWLIVVPFVNIWYLWKWSAGVEHVTKGGSQGMVVFLVTWLLGPIGNAIVQDTFNTKVV